VALLWSFEALARLAQRAAPEVLAPAETWLPPGDLARAWPFRAALLGGVECRLGEPAAADLAFCLSAPSGAREALVGDRRMLLDGGPVAAAAPLVATFLRQWCDPGSPLHRDVPVVWLEFDHPSRAGRRASPFVVYMVGAEAQAPSGIADVIREGAMALSGPGGTSAAVAAVVTVERMTGLARLMHVGVAAGPDGARVRLIVKLSRSAVAGMLTALDWPGDASAVGHRLEALWPADESVSVHLDVGHGLGSRVGVEFYRPSSPLDDPAWQPLLDGIVTNGLCTADQRDALSAWPDREREETGARPSLRRQLLVKAVFARDQIEKAKAYLAIIPRPLFSGSPEHISPSSAPAP